MDKQKIRKIMKEKRLINKTFFTDSKSITQKVLKHPQIQEAKMIGIYVSLPGEVDTMLLIEKLLKTHRVCVPKVFQQSMDFYEIHSLNDLQEGYFHVLEPITNHLIQSQDIDVMIIPMLAFDKQNYRVGYGKGYYDRYMNQNFIGYKLGIAFSWQEVEEIDIDCYDVSLDEIISE